MKVFNSKLAAIGLAAFVFASCSDSNSDGPSTNPDILDATTIGLTQSDAASLAASVTNYKVSANAGARRFSRAADETLFNGLTSMPEIPTIPGIGVNEITGATNLEEGQKYYYKGDGTLDLRGQSIKGATLWVRGKATVIYDKTEGNNKIYVQPGAHLVFKGTGAAVAAGDEIIIAKAGDFKSDNDITIDGTLYCTTHIGELNAEKTEPAQNVTVNGNVFLYGYVATNDGDPVKDENGKEVWNYASIRAKKLTIGANARVNVADKIYRTNDVELNGALHVGRTMEVSNLTINNGGQLSSDASIKVKQALTMNAGSKITTSYLNVTSNTYNNKGQEHVADGNSVATLNGNCQIILSNLGVINLNTLKTDNTAGQIVLNSNDASGYSVVKADKFIYTGSDDNVKCFSTPQDNSATFLLQLKKCYKGSESTEVNYNDLAFDASYLDYDVATDGAALEPQDNHTWKLKDDVAAKIQKNPKLDLIASLGTPDGQSATSIIPANSNLYISYHTYGSSFGGNIEVANMSGSTLSLLQNVSTNGEDNKTDFNHLNVIDGKLFLAGSNNAGAVVAYANLSNGTIDTNTGLTTLPTWRNAQSKDDAADHGDANCVVKWGNNIYVATTRGYEIYDPSQNYLHTNVTMPGKAKFMATSTEGLIGLNYGTDVKAGDAAVNGQMVCFTSADLQSRSRNFNLGDIAPNNGKNMVAVGPDGKIYACQSAKGLSCWNANGTKAWTNNYVTPINTKGNKSVDNRLGYINGVAVDANYVYVAAGAYGLVVLDKDGNVVAHRAVGEKHSANYVAVDGTNIYVAYGTGRVQVFKLTNTAK